MTARRYGPSDLDALYRFGRKNPQRHPGYDCFFWRRKQTDAIRLYVRGVFVGYPPVGRVLAEALRCVARSYREVRGAHHTFHLGDRNGGWNKYPEYEHMNRRAAKISPSAFSRVAGCGRWAGRACDIQKELAARPFKRFDVPGTEWPPKEVRR